MTASAGRPRVVVHAATSIDGHTIGFPADAASYYGVGARFGEDATLTGADTLLTAMPALAEAPKQAPPGSSGDPTVRVGGDRSRPLLVVTDGRGRIRDWTALRLVPYWRDVVALVCGATPPERVSWLAERGFAHIRAGRDRVDLAAALAELSARFNVRTLRVDSGGSISGALLAAGLVDEVSVLIHPFVAAAAADRGLFVAPHPTAWTDAVPLRLVSTQQIGEGLIWLRYDVLRA